MENLGAILTSPLLRALREQLGERPATVLHEEDVLARPMPVLEVPSWAVGTCRNCKAFLRRSAYLKCKLCDALICKVGNCKDLHGILHRLPPKTTHQPEKLMRKALLILCLLFAGCCARTSAQQPAWLTLTANGCLQDGFNHVIASGWVTLQPVNGSGNPQAFTSGDGKLSIPAPYKIAITNGGITSVQIPNEATTNPQHIGLNIVVYDKASGNTFRFDKASLVDDGTHAVNLCSLRPSSYATAVPIVYVHDGTGGSSSPATDHSFGTVELAPNQASAILSVVASTGAYGDLTGRPSLGSAATTDSTAYDAAGAAATAQATAVASSLQKSANLSDLGSAATARTNLGLGSAATTSASAYDAAGAAAAATAGALQKTSNLGDLSSAATARTNLGLGSAAVTSASAYDAAGAAAAATASAAQKSANLGDLSSAASARTNLGLGTAAQSAATDFDAAGAAASAQSAAAASSLQKSSNLADLTSTATARTNLGLGSAATTSASAYDAAGAAASAQSAAVAASLQRSSNLSDLGNAATARTNLGLGGLALLSSLPAPSTSTLGGVKSYTSASHQFVTQIATDGSVVSAQPSFSDVSGSVATAQLPPAVVYLSGTPTTGRVTKWINATTIGDATPNTDYVTPSGSISGNAGTATALAATPSTCPTGQAPTGVLANGNATGCAAISSSSSGGLGYALMLRGAGSLTSGQANALGADGQLSVSRITKYFVTIPKTGTLKWIEYKYTPSTSSTVTVQAQFATASTGTALTGTPYTFSGVTGFDPVTNVVSGLSISVSAGDQIQLQLIPTGAQANIVAAAVLYIE